MDREWFYRFFEQDHFRKTPEQLDEIIEQSIPQKAVFLIESEYCWLALNAGFYE